MPIYDQIVRQVKFAIASGALRPGELVPSVREAAKQAAVNPNTVARAYRELQAEGVLRRVRGTGLAVTEDAPAYCRKERVKLLEERLRQVLEEAAQSGLSEAELRQLVEKQLRLLSRSRGRRGSS
ncbi:MAG: GntR family transcriptional regulator [Planctomycetota bacterium]|nr:MAG: GntR family transcriptional regulator [Planctomycetota bacterium]